MDKSQSEFLRGPYLESLKWEMGKLIDLATAKDIEVQELFKLSLKVFSVVTSGIALYAVYTIRIAEGVPFSEKGNSLYLMLAILFATGIINFSIINKICNLNGFRYIIIRQINCLRLAVHSVYYSVFEGNYPSGIAKNSEVIKNEEAANYNIVAGQHRRMSVDNDLLRDAKYSSPNMISIYVIALLSGVNILAPVWFWWSDSTEKVSVSIAVIIFLLFLIGVAWTLIRCATAQKRASQDGSFALTELKAKDDFLSVPK